MVNIEQFDYIISISGSDITAYNTATETIEFSSTDSRTTFKNVVSALDSTGGGSCLVKKGTYIMSDVPQSITLEDNQAWVGEDTDLTRILGQSTTNEIFKRVFTPLTNFKMSNMTIESNGVSTCLYTSGSKDCHFENCVFKFTSPAPSSRFIVFFDTVNNANDNERLIVNHCRLEGDTAGQDMMGSGNMYGCDISNNLFKNGGGQGIGVNTATGSKYNNNYFYIVKTNPIGFENVCESNQVNGNICISCNGAIKLSQLNTDNKSINNICCNNIIEYGYAGIEAGWSEGDIISYNVFRRLRNWAIRGTLSGAIISGNQFYETNYDNHDSSIAGSTYTTGGIVLSNNVNFTNPRLLRINNNYFYTSRNYFVIPSEYINGGQTKKGFTGGILIDTNNKSNIVIDATNIFDNTFNTVINKGTK
jgi:hypothetical protein